MIYELLGMVGSILAMYVILELIVGVRELDQRSSGGSRTGHGRQ